MSDRDRNRAGRLRAWGANCLLVAAAFVAVGVALELGVRAFDPQPANLYRFSPVSFYEPIPGARFVYRRREFSVPIAYNTFGMRDRERRTERGSAALCRIALIGDSQVEAKEVPFDSTLGQRLERGLQQALPSRPVEVLNLGVSGYGTVATRARYQHLGLRFRPDIVVYLFMENDPGDNLAKDAMLYEDFGDRLQYRKLYDGRIPISRRLVDGLKHRLQSYAFLKFRLEEIRRRPSIGNGDPPATPTHDTERVTRLAIADLQDVVRSHGGELAIVQAGTRGPDMSAWLRSSCADLDIPFLDLEPALRAFPEPVRWQYDGHWRSAGHRAAANAVLPFLQDLIRERDASPSPTGPASRRLRQER